MRLLAIVSVLALGSSVMAADGPLNPTPIASPNLRCALDGEMSEFVFSHDLKKVWIAVDGIKTGIEMNVKSYQPAKGLGAFGVQTELAGVSAEFAIEQIGPGQIRIRSTVTSTDENGVTETAPNVGTCMKIQ